MTIELYDEAVSKLAEEIYNDAINLHPVLFENKWTFMGGSISNSRNEMLKSGSDYSNKLSIGASHKMLVDAFEGMIQSPDERKLVDAYRSYLSAAEDIEAALREVRSQIQQKVKEKAPRRSLLTVLIVILRTLSVVERNEESPSKYDGDPSLCSG